MAPAEPTADGRDGRRVRGDATRASLVEAATSLFAARGYSATSLAAISRTTGIKSASIYHAFGSKEGLLQAVMRKVADEMFDALEQVLSDSSHSLQQRAVRTSELLEERPEFLRLFLVLTLERREGDPAILSVVEDIRTRGRRLVADALRPELSTVPAPVRERILDDFARLTLMLLDGVFLARQIDVKAGDDERTSKILVTALEGALLHMLNDMTPT